MIGIIMAGGVGTRFWPLSRPDRPKQFLSILSERSMIQMTADRLRGLVNSIYVVTSADQAHLVREQLPKLNAEQIIIEPFGRNTAPCIGLSVAWLHALGIPDDETLLVVPADHVIGKVELFHSLVRKAETAARDGYLVTFGIVPDYPATGYGYIESGELIDNDMFHMKQFKEKPDRNAAETFLAQGGFYWNSGMFLWSLGAIRHAFQTLMPDVHTLLDLILDRWRQQGQNADIADIYGNMPRVPIDIGVMERAAKRAVVPADIVWSDVGGWQALYDLADKDEHDNAGNAERLALDSSGCYVHADKPVALVGVHDLVIVETDDALLICNRSDSERVKEIAKEQGLCP
ncbi:MAG: mannose-1-phosphate guanylyltransferase [Candidatus Cloacimonetes bacterium]|nr:mannose-1-phosphate guanylyltransferase [Candidatus Cloacimonadota bacterium]